MCSRKHNALLLEETVKNLLRNFALGMFLALPAAVYAQTVGPGPITPLPFDNGYPGCCTGCDGTKTCLNCKKKCTSQCSGSQTCRDACDLQQQDGPCAG